MNNNTDKKRIFFKHTEYGTFYRDHENNLCISFEVKPTLFHVFLSHFEKFLKQNKKTLQFEMELKDFELIVTDNKIIFNLIFENTLNLMTLKDYLINFYHPDDKQNELNALMFLLKLTHFGISLGYITLKEKSNLGYLDPNDILIRINSICIKKRGSYESEKHFGNLIHHDYKILGLPDFRELLPFVNTNFENINSFKYEDIYIFKSNKFGDEIKSNWSNSQNF